MNLVENIKMSFESLLGNKMRSLLTMLGIIIGISSVIAIVSVGNSMTESVTSEFQNMGMNNIIVSVKEKTDGKSGGAQAQMSSMTSIAKTPSDDDLLTKAEIDNFKDAYASEIEAISITESAGSMQLRNGHKYANVSVSGVNAGVQQASNIDVIKGNFIRESDEGRNNPICVISDKGAKAMFGTDDVVGQEVKAYSSGGGVKTYRIVGVYKYIQSSILMGAEADAPTPLYIPLSVAKLDSPNQNYMSFTIMAKTSTNSDQLTSQTKAYFSRFYRSNPEWEASAFNMADAMGAASTMLGTLSIVVAVIAGISLLVGGVGVMNIMLVSVTERTHEIGIRKALGARRKHIRMQFVTEAIIVSLVGGIIGILLGIGLAMFAVNLLNYKLILSPGVVGLAVGFSILIGLFFGYYPANKAAKLNPIDALRYE